MLYGVGSVWGGYNISFFVVNAASSSCSSSVKFGECKRRKKERGVNRSEKAYFWQILARRVESAGQ